MTRFLFSCRYEQHFPLSDSSKNHQRWAQGCWKLSTKSSER
nr:MAG TPA: hypothetical protein [Caudoviricetes sp.]